MLSAGRRVCVSKTASYQSPGCCRVLCVCVCERGRRIRTRGHDDVQTAPSSTPTVIMLLLAARDDKTKKRSASLIDLFIDLFLSVRLSAAILISSLHKQVLGLDIHYKVNTAGTLTPLLYQRAPLIGVQGPKEKGGVQLESGRVGSIFFASCKDVVCRENHGWDQAKCIFERSNPNPSSSLM